MQKYVATVLQLQLCILTNIHSGPPEFGLGRAGLADDRLTLRLMHLHQVSICGRVYVGMYMCV